ncbi:hypothetical protein [Paenibacillus amylolyticus]|uniref:hypothetical protein n=1 Tax=Paenibacillus amylolyticus TaxID=1451 RepID=UPI003D9710BD
MNTNESDKASLLIGGDTLWSTQHKTDLLITPYRWSGDDEESLPLKTGKVPTTYNAAPGYRIFRKVEHSPGYLSYGPYLKTITGGELQRLFITCAVDNLGNPNDLIAEYDLVDHANGGSDIVTPVQVKVSDLHGIRVFGIYLDRPIGLSPGMDIECRIFAHGGADLYFLHMYWDIFWT